MLPLLQIKDLTIDFPGSESQQVALDEVNIELSPGELLSIVGESGSGKSVTALATMRLLSTAARVRSGKIIFSPNGFTEIDMFNLPEKEIQSIRGNRLAMIFQEPMTSLNPLMTCGNQLMEPLILHLGMDTPSAKKEAIRLFSKVELPNPEVVFNKFPHELSGGQKQRVMIAMAISCKPSLLICDEPTTALDVRVQKTILDLLKNLCHSEKMGMIFITHDLGLVEEMADRVYVMLRGKIVEFGKVEDIFSNPSHPYTRGLLMCRPLFFKKGHRLPTISDYLENSGRSLTPEAEKPKSRLEKPSSLPTLIQVRNIGIRYGVTRNWLGRFTNFSYPLKNISFDVYQGETLGIVGESGSGKTSIGRALVGLNKPYTGSIVFGKTNPAKLHKKELNDFRKNIQIIFQDPYSSLNPRLKIGLAIAEPQKVHDPAKRYEAKEQATEWLKKVDLKGEYFARYPHEFSGGQRQRIVIARALILKPGIVVFDESVSALDVSIQAQVLNLINDLKRDLGFTAIFISHDLSVVRYLCDRVLVLNKGEIVESGATDSVFGNPQNPYTKALIDAIPGVKTHKRPDFE